MVHLVDENGGEEDGAVQHEDQTHGVAIASGSQCAYQRYREEGGCTHPPPRMCETRLW